MNKSFKLTDVAFFVFLFLCAFAFIIFIITEALWLKIISLLGIALIIYIAYTGYVRKKNDIS
jgi:threonine/homoserine/homoserine lactone efflux protein